LHRFQLSDLGAGRGVPDKTCTLYQEKLAPYKGGNEFMMEVNSMDKVLGRLLQI
jgi:hypothetical protein